MKAHLVVTKTLFLLIGTLGSATFALLCWQINKQGQLLDETSTVVFAGVGLCLQLLFLKGLSQCLAAQAGRLKCAEETILVERAQVETQLAKQTANFDLGLSHLKEELAITAKAQVDAEAADAAKARFLAFMSHELKTPLNAIAGFTALLAKTPEVSGSEKAVKYLRNIKAGSEHMQRIVGDLLELAQIEGGQVSLDYTELPVSELLTEIVEFMRPIADEKRIKLATHIDFSGTILADGARVRQILLNLIGNSIKFTTSGDEILVGIRREITEDCIHISVMDHGPGIREEDLEAVFQPYVQFGAIEQRRKGNGLGLPVSRELARLHGGRLWVESNGIGKGCSFICELPVNRMGGVSREPRAAA